MSAGPLDPRLTPARPDLAAVSLRGRVTAQRFVAGQAARVTTEVLDVKRAPHADAPLDTQLLFGEEVTLYDEADGWAWVQGARDGYVGYVAAAALARSPAPRATHRVVVGRTFIYPEADMKRPVLGAVPLDGRVIVQGTGGPFARTDAGYVFAAHLAPVEQCSVDHVDVAEQLIGTPYLWGGKSPIGIDCSGLVQLALSLVGVAMPRDADMQERCGIAVPVDALQKGDLVFWPGHVGIMSGEAELLHASGHHMLVTRERFAEACARIAASDGKPVRSARRVLPRAK